jgi:hypothetical protein
MPSVKSGWQVSTSDEENAVDRFMPYITALMWSTWPTGEVHAPGHHRADGGDQGPAGCRLGGHAKAKFRIAA